MGCHIRILTIIKFYKKEKQPWKCNNWNSELNLNNYKIFRSIRSKPEYKIIGLKFALDIWKDYEINY